MNAKLSVELPCDKKCLSVARGVCSCLLKNLGITNEDISDVVIIIGELSANAIMHGKTPFTVIIEYDHDHVNVTVEDHGHGYDVDHPIYGQGMSRYEDGIERFGGWGILIVKRLSQSLIYNKCDDTGTSITVTKDVHYIEKQIPLIVNFS